MIRAARLTDVPAIKRLIDTYASQDQMLPRELPELYAVVRDFAVYEEDGEILGCAALHIFTASLAEIRSVAVSDRMKGKGIGRHLIEYMIEEARRLGLKQVFALTYVGGFFSKIGFRHLDDKGELPQKVWRDCIKCPKFPDCDEEAYIIEVKPAGAEPSIPPNTPRS